MGRKGVGGGGPGAHYPELPSSILTLWVNLVPYLFIFESTSHGVFRGCLHNSQSLESWDPLLFTSHTGRTKVFNYGESAGSLPFFKGVMRTSVCFRRKLEKHSPPPTYLSSKNKKIRDRADSRVQLVWRLRVMGSWGIQLKIDMSVIVPLFNYNKELMPLTSSTFTDYLTFFTELLYSWLPLLQIFGTLTLYFPKVINL